MRPSTKKRTKEGSGWEASSDARAGMLMGVARCCDCPLAEGLVGLWGQVGREWAPLQNEQMWSILQEDMLQPLSLKLLHSIFWPTNSRGRPRRSLDWEEAGKVVGCCVLGLGGRVPREKSDGGWELV